jgi:hypothetical protein
MKVNNYITKLVIGSKSILKLAVLLLFFSLLHVASSFAIENTTPYTGSLTGCDYYIDASLPDQEILLNGIQTAGAEFRLFSHLRLGELFINNQRLEAKEIAFFFSLVNLKLNGAWH